MKPSLKQVFESDSWIITQVMEGRNQQVRVDARRRFPEPVQGSFFSGWGASSYINCLSRANYGKNIEQLNTFRR